MFNFTRKKIYIERIDALKAILYGKCRNKSLSLNISSRDFKQKIKKIKIIATVFHINYTSTVSP